MTQPIHPMLERVARAIAPHIEADSEIYWAAEYGRPIPPDSLVAIARAAIQALMEPDEGQRHAVGAAVVQFVHGNGGLTEVYLAGLKPLLGVRGDE